MIGTVLGERYRVDRELGANERETCYAATDLRMERAVTVRMPAAPRWSEPAWREAVSAGIRRAAPVAHPALQPILDFDLDADPPYIVQAAADGATVGSRLRAGGTFSAGEATRIAEEAITALAAVHRAGLVHGAVTPDSVLVAADGSVRLLDLDRPQAPPRSVDEARYLAPEQLVGQSVDARTDVYGLAATLYHALAGRPPFDAPDVMALGILKHTGRPEPLDELRPDVPPTLVAAIESALARDRAERPSSPQAFGEALTRPAPEPLRPPAADLAATTLLSAPPPSSLPPLPPPPQPALPPASAPVEREGGGCGAFLGVLLVLAIGGLLYWALVHPRGGIEAPPLAGKSQAQAAQALRDLGLKARLTGSTYDETVPDGQVLSQDPPAGTRLKPEEEVRFTLSKGSAYAVVPSLLNRTEREARSVVTKAGLTYGGSETVSQADAPDGVVVAQFPKAGAKAGRGDPVRVFINKRPKDSPAPPPTEPKEAETKGAKGEPGILEGAVGKAVEDIRTGAGKMLEDTATRARERTREMVKETREKAGKALAEQWEKVTGKAKPREQP